MVRWMRPAVLAGLTVIVSAATLATEPGKTTDEPAAVRDGSRDFDFLIGTWKVHLRRLVEPLTGSKQWEDMHGRTVVRKVLGGPANVAEMTVENAVTHNRRLGFSVRLYDPELHQWRIYYTPPTGGTMGVPVIGGFHEGRGEFYSQEEWKGRMILVRYVWDDITESSARFEQAFSTDGGKTWEPNWITILTREAP